MNQILQFNLVLIIIVILSVPTFILYFKNAHTDYYKYLALNNLISE